MTELEARYAPGGFASFAPRAEVEIDAPVEVVWRILTDFENYAAWNRFSPSVRCRGSLGSNVEMRVCFPGSAAMTQVEVLNVLEAPHRLAWGVVMGARTLLVANRYQTLESIGEGRSRYATIDYVSGLLAPLVRVLYAEKMRAGFQLAADGLKEFAEASLNPR